MMKNEHLAHKLEKRNGRVAINMLSVLATVSLGSMLLFGMYGTNANTSRTGSVAQSALQRASEQLGDQPAGQGDATPTLGVDAGDTATPPNGATPEPSGGGEDQAPVVEVAPTDQTGDGQTTPESTDVTLKQKITASNGKTYTVAVKYGSDAAIPAGAELRVTELSPTPEDWAENRETTYKDRPLATEEMQDESQMAQRNDLLRHALDLADDDYLFYSKYLRLEIVADGQPVTPQVPVQVTVRTNDVSAARSDSMEFALLSGGEATRLEAKNLTERKKDTTPEQKQWTVRFSMTVDRLGELAIAGVASPQLAWDVNGTKVTILGPRTGVTLTTDEAIAPTIPAGMELAETAKLVADPVREWDEALWLTCTPAEDLPEGVGVVVWHTENETRTGTLCSTGGTKKPFEIASGQQIAMLWDTGLRETTLESDAVTLDGLLPKAGEVQAAPADVDAASTTGDEERRTVAAYDVTVATDTTDGWQPNAEQPVAVTIMDKAIDPSKDVSVLMVNADGETREVADAQVDNASVSFMTDELGTYVVTERVTLERTVEASDGRTYQVSVTYDTATGVPRDAELRVRELEGDEYAHYLERARSTLDERSLGMRAFDIALTDADGNEYEPTGPVSVSIRLVEGKDQPAPEEARVVHFANDDTADPEVIDPQTSATDDGMAYDFTTESFSVYAVAYTVDFHWGDYTYNLEGGSTIFLSELLETLINGASEGGNQGSEAAEGTDGTAEAGTSTEGTENRSQANGSAGVYDTTTLKKVLADPSLVEKVAFSDPELMEVLKSYIVDEDTTADQDEEDDEALAGTEGEAKSDWALVSKNPFDTAETLTITLTDGSRIEIPTTDERVSQGITAGSGGRVTVDGVTYTLQQYSFDSNYVKTHSEAYGDNMAYYGRATVYALSAGCTIHDEILYGGNLYKVWNIKMTGAALQGTTNKMDRELVNRAAGYKFSLPRVRTSIADIESDPNVTQAELDSLPTTAFKAGDNNSSSGNQVWKKATFNPATNSIDYEIKTFQAMKQDVPLDFIFIYDDSITMYTGDRGAPRNNVNDNRDETVIREAQATRIMILSAAQALTSRTDGYDIRVAMGGASNNDNRRSSWYDVDADASAAYAGIEGYLATYKTGATSHVVGLNNALTLARQSVSASRQPIVIYLSDFKDGAINNSTATQLKNIARVYTLQTADRTSPYPRASTITSDTSTTFFNMSEIDDGVQKLEKVILDAIGYYMKDKVTITDNLSDALSSMTPQDDATSYVTQDGTAKTGAGTTTDATGKNTWEVGGTSPYLGAGTVYTENFSVKLDDNKVYTGDIPTNGKATVYVDGKKVNEITPDEGNPDELHVAKTVTFLLGKLDDHDEYTNQVDSYGAPLSGNLIDGIKFTLQEANKSGNNYTAKSGATSYEYTTDSDGAITVPYKSGSNVVLQSGHYYLLTEDGSTVDTYNSAAGRDPLLKAPDKSWVITVTENGEISVAPQNGAGQTPGTSIAKANGTNPARIVLWNMIQVPATLIPITVQKVWPDNDHPHDPVPFTIFGVDRTTGSRVEKLAAYDGDDAATATQVRYIAEGSKGFSKSADGLTWTQTVYVLNKDTINGTEYKFFDRRLLTDDGSQYDVGGQKKTFTQLMATYGDEYGVDTDDDGTKDALRYGQTYSYDILEGELKYDFGWYAPEYQNTATKNHENGGNYENEAPTDATLSGQTYTADIPATSGWNTVSSSDSQSDFVFLLNLRHVSNSTYQNEFRQYFDISGSNTYLIPDDAPDFKKVFHAIDSLEVVVKDLRETSNTGSDVYYRFTVNKPPANGFVIDNNWDEGNCLFYGMTLPKIWSDTTKYPIAKKRSDDFGRISNLEVQEVYATFTYNNVTRSYVLYSKGPGNDELGTQVTYSAGVPNTEGYADNQWGVGIYRERSNHTYANHYGKATTTSSDLEKYHKTALVPGGYTPSGDNYELKGLPTLTITNTWHENPLFQVTVEKEWEVDEDATGTGAPYGTDIHNAKQDVVFSLNGTNESGETKPVDIFTPASETDEAVAAMKTAWNTAGSGGASTGTIAKTDTNKDQAEWEKTFYVPTYDMSTYKRTVNDDGTETITGPEVYTYTKTNLSDAEKTTIAAGFTERDLTAGTDDDGQKKGEWSSESDFTTAEEWAGYLGTKKAYVTMDRNTSINIGDHNTYSNITAAAFYYTDSTGKLYESVVNLSSPVATTNGNLVVEIPFPYIDPDSISLVNGGVLNGKYKYNTTIAGGKSPFTNEKYGYYGYLTINSSGAMGAPAYSEKTGYAAGIDLSKQTYTNLTISFDKPADYDSRIKVAGSGTLRTYSSQAFTLTNTYTPYKEVKLSSAFSDASDDRNSTAEVKKVIYTVKDSNGEVVRTTDMAMEDGSGESGTTVRQSYFQPTGGTKRNYKSIYLPKGSYAISQSYTLDNGDSAKQYALDDSLDAYDVTYNVDNGSATDGTAYTASIDGDRTLAFTNTRKTMPIRVTMDWEPGLTEDEDPLKSTSKMIPYKISYDTADTSADTTDKVEGNYAKTYKTSNNGTEISQNLTDTDFSLEYARQTNDHAAGIPTYSVREMLTQCDFSYKDGEGPDVVEKNYLEEILPDYDCNVKQEEIDSNNDGKKDTMVFTVEAHIKRAAVIIEKNFDEAFDFDKYKGATITYTLERDDGENIYGTGTKKVDLVMKVPSDADPGTMNGTIALNGEASIYCDAINGYYSGLDDKTKAVYGEDESVYLPVLRSSVDVKDDKPVKYILKETVSGGEVNQYFPSFTDQTNNADNKFEQTNPAGKNEDTPQFGKANTAKFILNPAGIIIGIGNAETPYICKIVETFGTGENKGEVENPFRTLNAALDFARRNGNGQAMSATNPVKIEMLVDYVIPSADKVTLDKANDNIIITTAATSGGVYNFTPTFTEGTAAGDRLSTDGKATAILKRGSDVGNNSLFTVSDSNAFLRTENIIFDGAGISVGTNGTIIKASSGSLTIAGDTMIRNSKTNVSSNDYGGAIYAPVAVLFTTEQGETILFKNCETNKEGGVIETNGHKLTINNKGTLKAENCSGTYGGFICTDSSGEVEINNSGTIEVTDCKATSNDGGAIFTGIFKAENNSGSISFTGCTASNGGAIIANKNASTADTFVLTNTATGTANFTNCSASNGGAVYVNSGKCTITGADVGHPVTFEGCTASGNGGAIYQNGGDALTLTNVTFGEDGDKTKTKACIASSNGGAVYTKASAQADLTNVKVYGAGSDANSASSGGAIYAGGNAALTIEGAEFKDLKVSGNGGAIYQNGGNALTLTNVTFGKSGNATSGCSAASTGGAIYTAAAGTLTDCSFYYCKTTSGSSGGGGAIFYANGIQNLYGCVFDHCEAAGGGQSQGLGGAIKYDNGGKLVIDRSDARRSAFTNCTANRFGGAIAFELNGGTFEVKNTDFTSCVAASKTGGAIGSDAATLNIVNSTFNDCKAEQGNGGAICAGMDGVTPNVQMENSVVTGCASPSGAAIYSKGNLTIRQTGTGTSEIKNCSASGNNGGAVNVTGDSTTMTFEGNVVVYGNTNTSYDKDHQHNVVLEKGNSTTILTSGTGLGADAHIGVYVIGVNASPYNGYGRPNDPFGTMASTDNGTYLFRFTNDRNNSWGVKRTDTTIYWNDPIVKVTDKDNVLLYELKVDNDGTENDVYLPAVYERLNDGLTAARGTLYTLSGTTYTAATAMDTSNLRQMKMLKDYVIPEADKVTLDKATDNLIITTAETTAPSTADTYIFADTLDGKADTDKGTAILKRGAFKNASLFDAINASAKIAFRKIILDGDGENRTVTVPGGLVHSAGTVEVQSGTTMRNTKSSGSSNLSEAYGGGGAIWARDVAINGNTGSILFDNCFAKYSGGAIYYSHHFDMNDNSGSITFKDCSMNGAAKGDGGAISNWESGSDHVFAATNNSGSIEFINCRAENDCTQGGAIFQLEGGNITLASTGNGRIRFSGCYAGAGGDTYCGGAISAWKNDVTISLTGTATSPIVFENCYAKTGNGGAIYTPGNVVLTNVRFGGYKTDASGNYVDASGNALAAGEKPVVDSAKACYALGSGGAVYAKGNVTFKSTAGATYTGCYGCYGSSGGAIYAGSAVSANENGGTLNFENCHSSGTGGAIYASSVSLNDNSGTLNFDGCYTTDSDAHGGAIRADGGVTMNSNSGNIKFNDCHSGTKNSGDADGGAIAVYVRGKTFSATDNTGTISFENCTTSAGKNRQGGAIILLGGTMTMASTGSGSISFKDCYANADSDKLAGGAISVWDRSSTITLTGTVEHPIIFEGCHTNGAGGAIVNNNSGIMNLTCVSFDDCYAEGTNGNGGAVYTNGTLNMTNVNITGHSGGTDGLAVGTANAKLGGAVYTAGSLTIRGGTIKNCSASDGEGGAVNVANEKTVFFEGSPVVYDNKVGDQQKNVVLDQNNNTTIQTTATGLTSQAHIGVYVTGDDETVPYSTHGISATPFGTFATGGDKYLESFHNDRHPELRGTKAGDVGITTPDSLIYWSKPFVVYKSWEGVDKGDYDNYTVYFRLYQVDGSSWGRTGEGQPLPAELISDWTWPTAESIPEQGQVDLVPGATVPGFFAYGDGYYFVRENADLHRNNVGSGPVNNTDKFVRYTGRVWGEGDLFEASRTQRSLRNARQGDLFFYGNQYYVCRNDKGVDDIVTWNAETGQWELNEGKVGFFNDIARVAGSGTAPSPSGPLAIQYTTQDEALAEADKLRSAEGGGHTVVPYVDGADMDGLYELTKDDDPDNDGVWSRSFAKLPAGTYYAVEEKVLDGRVAEVDKQDVIGNFAPTYVYLQKEKEVTITNGPGGSNRVVLRKVQETDADKHNEPLEGAVFEIERASGSKIKDESDATSFTSQKNGVFFVGELTDGVYFVHETKVGEATVEKWFYCVVDETGTTMSAGYGSKADAKKAYDDTQQG